MMNAHDTEFAAALDRLLLLTVLLNDDMERGLRKVKLTPSQATLLWLLRRVEAKGPSHDLPGR